VLLPYTSKQLKIEAFSKCGFLSDDGRLPDPGDVIPVIEDATAMPFDVEVTGVDPGHEWPIRATIPASRPLVHRRGEEKGGRDGLSQSSEP
jgi:hypothetical protein